MLPEITDQRIALARATVKQTVERIFAGKSGRNRKNIEFRFKDGHIHYCGHESEGVGFEYCEGVVVKHHRRRGEIPIRLTNFSACVAGARQLETRIVGGRKKQVERWKPGSYVRVSIAGVNGAKWHIVDQYEWKFYLRSKKWERIPSSWEKRSDRKRRSGVQPYFVIR